jgi:glyoxylase-like metal-dependent hydrolase (beta-lactamase superfamily II)
MHIETFFDARTWTLTYVVHDPATLDAVVIDPVLDLDTASGKVFAESIDKVDAWIRANELNVRAILETHAHADHLTGAQELKRRTGAPIMVGKRITEVQAVFAPVFELDIPLDGSQFDRLLGHGEVMRAGSVQVRVLSTPGHTPACTSFVIGDAVFTGDALFMPDSGVGRCDFPGGSADALYTSVHDVLYALPPSTRLFVGHDYQPGGRPVAFESTIAASKASNVHLRDDTSREDFVAMRKARDATLSAPKLLLPSIQVNIDAGRLPSPTARGGRFMRLPIKIAFGS